MEQVIRVTRKDKVTPQAGRLPEGIKKAFKLLRHNAQTLDDTYLRDAIDLIEKHLAEREKEIEGLKVERGKGREKTIPTGDL